MRLCILRIGIRFLKDPGFRALVGLRDPFEDLCCGCVEGISIWSDRLPKARGTEERIHKRQFFSILFSILLVISIRLVLVSDPGSVSPFFLDVSTGPTFCLCGPRRKRVRREEGCTMIEARRSTSFIQTNSNIRHGFWQCNGVGLSCRSEWIILLSTSTEVHFCLLGKSIASYKFCLSRICLLLWNS